MASDRIDYGVYQRQNYFSTEHYASPIVDYEVQFFCSLSIDWMGQENKRSREDGRRFQSPVDFYFWLIPRTGQDTRRTIIAKSFVFRNFLKVRRSSALQPIPQMDGELAGFAKKSIRFNLENKGLGNDTVVRKAEYKSPKGQGRLHISFGLNQCDSVVSLLQQFVCFIRISVFVNSSKKEHPGQTNSSGDTKCSLTLSNGTDLKHCFYLSSFCLILLVQLISNLFH